MHLLQSWGQRSGVRQEREGLQSERKGTRVAVAFFLRTYHFSLSNRVRGGGNTAWLEAETSALSSCQSGLRDSFHRLNVQKLHPF